MKIAQMMVLLRIFIVGLWLGSPLSAHSQIKDPNPAVNNPDKFAWDLFIEVNRPALEGKRGVPDPSKRPGDPGLRVWETWKITSTNGNEVFLQNGARPSPWEDVKAKLDGKYIKLLSPPKMNIIKGNLANDPHFDLARSVPKLNELGQESRINQVGFDFILNENLYSLDGQERFRKTQRKVEFPIGTINVKATWRQFTRKEIEAGVPNRFYTAADDKSIWGLTGFHMTSKDLPNWFWATFEHAENPSPEIPDRDRHTKFRNPRSSTGVFVEQRLREVPGSLKGSYWENYVLRGTQVDFIDSTGSPTILGNTQLENGMQTTSSCMGCHARSTIGDRLDDIVINGRRVYPNGTYLYPSGRLSGGANRLTVNPAQVAWQQDPQNPDPSTASFHVTGAIGAPNPEWFTDSAGRSRYTQLDFIWAFIHAERETN